MVFEGVYVTYNFIISTMFTYISNTIINFYRSSEPSIFLTASALGAIYKLYSVSSGNHHGGQRKHSLPLTVDARVIERCLHWIFVHQVYYLFYS